LRYGKPTFSMTLNGVLAGLVAITAGCDVVTPAGAILIGLMAGVLVVFSVEFIDRKLKVDDPVGAVSVHGVCGAFGTLMVGLFSADAALPGLFYGGSAGVLVSQAIGVLAIAAWAAIAGSALFVTLKYTIGIRVSSREEEIGLDYFEHGEKAYN
ncbi:MAG: ammonium transporter, partial [Proteiniphilum sp.]